MFVINHGTYPFDILICIGSKHKEIVKKLKKVGITLDEEETEMLWMKGSGRTVMLKNGVTVLRVDFEKNKAIFHSVLAHEIFHAVEFLFDRIKLKHNQDISGEAFAYQIQHLTKQIYDKLK